MRFVSSASFSWHFRLLRSAGYTSRLKISLYSKYPLSIDKKDILILGSRRASEGSMLPSKILYRTAALAADCFTTSHVGLSFLRQTRCWVCCISVSSSSVYCQICSTIDLLLIGGDLLLF